MTGYNQEIIKFLKELIKIDTTKQPPKPNKPFGEGIFRALNFTLDKAKSLGFECHNYQNYVGEIVVGSGEELAVLCHLDVVPVGDETKWDFPPFSGEIDGEFLYGRGAVDDKGPLSATLFALKKLKDENFDFKKQIRFILGCDEESGWGCIDHYKKIRPLPESGFSPDASFPVIYAEKGIIHFNAYFNYNQRLLESVSGGVASNVVCDRAIAKCKIDSQLAKKYGLNVIDNQIESLGITAHASEPQNGKNAINSLIAYLFEIGAIEKDCKNYLFDDLLGLKNICDETGNLTLSPNVIKIEKSKLCLTCDLRYPATMNFNQILPLIEKIGEIEILSHQPPLYNDKNSPLISTLCSVYNKISGDNAKPIAIGGGTYARALNLGCGFGPETSDEPLCAHQPNERIKLSKLEFMFNVYYNAIKELCS